MSRWLIDTNVFIEAAAARPHASKAIRLAPQTDWVAYSVVTRIEALGFWKIEPEEERELLRLFGTFTEIELAETIVEKAIDLRRDFKMELRDAIIAATAIINSAELVTRNLEDFKHVAGLKVDPTTL